MTRQYIGARYVTKVYENSQNPSSAEWENGVEYEPLTMVTYQNSSYLSKKTVPVTVGDPASNGTYWVQTGYYNGQITSLQEQINAINDNFSTMESGFWLHGKKVVAYGDSTIEEPSYLSLAASAADFTLTNRQVSGSYMNIGVTSGINLINAASDLNDYDYMFLCYGTNEWQYGRDVRELIDDVDLIITAALNKNPNLQIIFVVPFFSYHDFNNGFPANCNARGYTLEQSNDIILDELERIGIPYIDFYHHSSCTVHNYSHLLNSSGGIYVHPTTAFKSELAQIILNGINYDKLFNYYSLFNTVDFTTGRDRVTKAELNSLTSLYNYGGLGYGMAIKINANETLSSQRKFFNRGRYVFRGHTTDTITIAIDTVSFIVPAGDFEFNYMGGYSFSDVKITAGANGALIGDFNCYAVDRYDDRNYNYDFGASYQADKNPSFTYNQPPLFEYDNDGIFLACWSVQVGPSDNGATLFTLPNDINISQDVLVGIAFNSGETVAAYITGNTCKLMSAPSTTDHFLFSSKMLRNMHQRNVEYP